MVLHRLAGATLGFAMPTARPRHSVTESDAIARALDDAARRWPEDADKRGKLLLRLVELGHAELAGELEQARERRRRAVEETAGALTGVYRPNELEILREDWPE